MAKKPKDEKPESLDYEPKIPDRMGASVTQKMLDVRDAFRLYVWRDMARTPELALEFEQRAEKLTADLDDEAQKLIKSSAESLVRNYLRQDG